MKTKNIVGGGLYKVLHNEWNNDQSYGGAIPVHYINDKFNTEHIYMQDTYQLPIPSMNGYIENKHEAAVRTVIEYGECNYSGGCVKQAQNSYYYKNQEDVTNCSIEQFNSRYELVCDLHEYEYCRRPERYDPVDIIPFVKLYFEHGYSGTYGPLGIDLVRKGAIESKRYIAKDEIAKHGRMIQYPIGLTEKEIEFLNNVCKYADLNENEQQTLERLISYGKKLDEGKREFEIFRKEGD